MGKLRAWEPTQWTNKGGYRKKEYDTYDEYVKHQKRGWEWKETVIMNRFERDVERFKANFKVLDFLKDKSCLCLGARSGAEVKALRDLGNIAVGIDLITKEDSPYCEIGDFHKLRFANNTYDVVYTNAFDHVFDLEKALKEVKRVLKMDGWFIIEMVVGYKEGGWPGDHEAAYWENAQEFLNAVMTYGFYQVGNMTDVPQVKGLPFKRAILKVENNLYKLNEDARYEK